VEYLPRHLIPIALTCVIALFALEPLWYRLVLHRRYAWKESCASLILMFGYRISSVLMSTAIGVIYAYAWQLRPFTIPLNTLWGAVLLFLGVEFIYYWIHRLSHEIRWMWATHVVHHSPEHLNLFAAFRLGWTNLLSGSWLFLLPLVALGFAPSMVLMMLGINLLYQFWIHTDVIPKLGPLEWILNTPSLHRVHHATNPEYLDRNYGGILIIFDRLFGTFAEERAGEPCRYGLVRPVNSINPLYMFGTPGWSPDGSRETTAMIRRRARIDRPIVAAESAR
jgi:sterol desaturase/sphingolipid hydroxylase (fatty acid hydroxylase superfamily)